MMNGDGCFCYRDFTVEEFKNIVEKLIKGVLNRLSSGFLHFLAQAYHETHFFQSMQECTSSYTVKYDPYRRRGFIHLTHKKVIKILVMILEILVLLKILLLLQQI
ncbi:hypothetical protein [Rodentibacter caecimuris]